MKTSKILCLLLLILLGQSVHIKAFTQIQSSGNLVFNSGFEISDPVSGIPEGWNTYFPRQEISPEFNTDNTVSHSGKCSIRISSKGSKGTFGLWTTTVKGIKPESSAIKLMSGNSVNDAGFLSNKSFLVGCYYKTSGIEFPERNIRINVTWVDNTGNEIFTEFISQEKKEGEWYHTAQLLTAPHTAVSLSIQLVLQWSDSGTVWWDDISVEEAPSLSNRKVKMASSNSRPSSPSTPEKNLIFYSDKITSAGKLGVDMLCLGEGVTIVSTTKSFNDVAETIPGPSTRILGEAARKASMYVVAGIYERDGSLIYNTAILLDRKGNIAGKYRKTHLPQTEIIGGITPGTEYPVFKTDFGIVGIQICYDNFFPEVVRHLVLNGAEVVFLPIWGDIRGENYAWDIVARARAIDNAVFLVSSMYDGQNGSIIIDPNGKILPDADGIKGLTTSEIDLNMRTFERWLSVRGYGEWKNLFPNDLNSESYK